MWRWPGKKGGKLTFSPVRGTRSILSEEESAPWVMASTVFSMRAGDAVRDRGRKCVAVLYSDLELGGVGDGNNDPTGRDGRAVLAKQKKN